MRLFLAIDLPSAVKIKLAGQLRELKADYKYLRWLPEKSYHATLLFFGEITKPDKIIKGVEEIVYDIPSTHLYSQSAGIFVKSKITLYLELRRDKNIEKLVEEVRERLNMKSNKKFVLHLTLARYKLPSKQQYFVLKKRLAAIPIDIDFAVSKIYLYESILDHGKPLYKKVATFHLAPR